MQDKQFKYTDSIDLDARTSHGLLFSLVGRGERVLEFGSGIGLFAEALRDRLCCSVTGVEISEEAANEARTRMDRVICADVEDAIWEDALAGDTFDTIVLADILEHLCDPLAFLRRIAPYLKENGKLLFSVPNIAHADVLAALTDGRFDYTDKGLLDSTHLHFFAKNNLPSFFEEAGLFLYHLNATVCERGMTEQNTVGANRALHALLAEQPTANAYQFIGVVCHKSYADAKGLTFCDAIPAAATGESMRVFYRKDEEELASDTPPTPNETTPTVLLLPAGTTELKIAVRKDAGYLIRAPRFLLGTEECQPSFTNGMIRFESDYLIAEKDAFFLFRVPADIGAFTFEGAVFAIGDDVVRQRIEDLADNLLARTDALAEEVQAKEALQGELLALKKEAKRLSESLAALESAYRHLEHDHVIVTHSHFWRLTKPFRAVLDAIKRVLRRIPLFAKLKKGFRYLRKNGVRRTRAKLRERSVARKKAKNELRYSAKILAQQKSHVFREEHTFSILVPLYNTPKRFLKEMIDSVTAQTYSHWELCLADGSDTAHRIVGEYCQARAAQDSRIKYKKLEKNMGISSNTNACIDMATGDYIVLFDHDDILHPAALYEFMSAIEKTGADFLYTDENTFSQTPAQAYCPHHKPDFSPDTLRSYNYICHLSCFSRELLDKVGRFRSAFDGSQDYDMILRLTEKAKHVEHIPRILYYWRAHASSVASDISAKPYTLDAAKRALSEHMERVGLSGEVTDARVPSTYRIRYKIDGQPLISIVIPNMDHTDILARCIDSIETLSTYPAYEILIVENNSREKETFAYYDRVTAQYKNVRIIHYESDGGFNFSAINNFAVRKAKGEHLLFLNNDIEVITPAWLEEMLMFSQRADVGAVGAMLYYPDDTIQHAGVILGIGGVAGHSHKYFHRGDFGYMSRLAIAQNLSAVTAACLMMKRSLFDEIGGYDETLAVAFNDVDLCMKIRESGHLIVFTPFAEAYHHESKSRGFEDTPEKVKRFNREIDRFHEKWGPVLKAGDPYYNPNLTLTHENFELL